MLLGTTPWIISESAMKLEGRWLELTRFGADGGKGLCEHHGSPRGTPRFPAEAGVRSARASAFFFELSTRRLGKSIVPTCWSEEEDECEECSLTAGPFCLGKDGGVGLKMDAGDGGKVATCLH